jgi:hypothetical protein
MSFLHRIALVLPFLALFLALPAPSLAASPGAGMAYTSPCNDLPVKAQYRCRRFEALSQVRAVAREHWKGEQSEYKEFQLELRNRTNDFYFGKTTQAERDEFRQALSDERAQLYKEWHEDWQELSTARRNLRRLTRLPEQKPLRLDLIEQKTKRLNASDKQSRRLIIKKQLEYIRSFR